MDYTRWMLVALGGGLGLTALEARRRDWPLIPVLDTALIALAVGVLGARAGYVASNWSYFHERLGEAVRWWRGGLLWQAGLVAGLIGALAYARYRRLPGLALLDLSAPGLAFGCALGWLASYSANCAYGVPVWPDQPLWLLAADLPDLYGVSEPRVAVQLLGAGWAALLGCALVSPWPAIGSRRPAWPGARLALFVCLYSAGLVALGFLRGDEIARLNGWRLDQALDAGLALASAVMLLGVRALPHAAGGWPEGR